MNQNEYFTIYESDEAFFNAIGAEATGYAIKFLYRVALGDINAEPDLTLFETKELKEEFLAIVDRVKNETIDHMNGIYKEE